MFIDALTSASTTTTKLPTAISSWLASWKPQPSTLKWSTLDAGCFYQSPLAVWETKYPLTLSAVLDFDWRLRTDMENRGVFGPSIFDPKLDPMKNTVFGVNPWDPLHFGILSLLDDLDKRGSEWAGQAAMRLLQSYYVNEKFPYLRTGGDINKPYGTQGRLRCAGWILHALAAASRMFKRWKIDQTNHQLASLLSLTIYSHLDRITKHWPLTADPDGPSGDHLDVPHCETFMLGIMREGLRQLGKLGFDTLYLLDKVEGLINAARVTPLTYVYDLRIASDGSALPSVPTDKVVTGVSGVNAWIGGEDLRTDAVKQGWPTKYPSLYAQFFGGVA